MNLRKDFSEEDITHSIVKATTQNSGLKYYEMVLVVWHNGVTKNKGKNCTVFRFDMTIGAELFKLFDKDGDGEVTADEVAVVMERADVKAYFKSLNNKALLELTKVGNNAKRQSSTSSKSGDGQKRVFSEAIVSNREKSDSITEKDWNDFMLKLKIESMFTMKTKAMLKNKKYMGLGLEPNKPFNALYSKCFGVSVG
jgi:hypothetical protein